MSDHRAAAAAARQALDALLESDAPQVAATLPATFGDAVERYVALLLEANDHLNLTRVVEPTAVARLHLLDALAAVPLLDQAAPSRALDLGTGGGVPGIVLALARPEQHWTLVDAVRKKADAVHRIVRALALRNVAMVAERAEILGRGDARARFDVVVARACASLPVLGEYALPLLAVGGRLIAFKGPLAAEELDGGAHAAAILGGGAPDVRPTGIAALGDHRFVIVPKVAATPQRYPRRPGEPARRPLA